MFSLVHGIYRELTLKPVRRVLLLGLQSSGKSSVLEWVKLMLHPQQPAAETLSKMTSTVGLNVFNLHLPSEDLLLWDLGGNEKLRPIWEPYIAQADAVIWVFDCGDKTSLAENAKVLERVVERPHLANKPLLVLANKQDLPGAMDAVAVALALDLLKSAEVRSQCVQPVSARSGSGIREGVEWLAQQLREPTSPAARKTSIK